jgi:hypothetical protein
MSVERVQRGTQLVNKARRTLGHAGGHGLWVPLAKINCSPYLH